MDSTLELRSGPIKAGSYSRLNVFNSCAYQAYLKYVSKIPEPERPALAADKEYPNDRGSRVHDYAEHFVRQSEGHNKLIFELVNFKGELGRLRELFTANSSSVLMEGMWLFDEAWQTLPNDCDIEDIFMRIILDVCIFCDGGTRAIVVDYKTGRRYGNEVKHAEQTQLYALAVFLRYPEVEYVTAELWYTDQDEIATMSFTRKQGMMYLKNWNNKMLKMTSAKVFPKKANTYSCRFCAYKTGQIGKNGPQGTGDCDKNPI